MNEPESASYKLIGTSAHIWMHALTLTQALSYRPTIPPKPPQADTATRTQIGRTSVSDWRRRLSREVFHAAAAAEAAVARTND